MRNKIKKILFLATNDFNQFGGGAQAIRAYLDSTLDIYGNESVDVMLGEEYELKSEYRNLNVIRVKKRGFLQSRLEVLKGYLDRWVTPMVSYLKEHANEYSTVVINGGRMGVVVQKIKKFGLRVVTIHHNEEIEYCMDNKHIVTLGGRWDYLVRRAQGLAYQHSDINLFLTAQDCEHLHEIYGENNKVNEVIGVYDYKSATKILPSTDECEYHIGASGSLVNYQTTHGILDIKNNYIDIIKELLPSYKLLLTGRNPSNEILEFTDEYSEHIAVIPDPQDIISVIQKCSIYLCPTDIGGGLKLRVMDGLKSGMPALVHKISARGYEMFADKPYFRIYEDRETFKKGLSDLLDFVTVTGKEERQQISKDFYSYFGYGAGTERFRRLLKENQ
jgi:glycosyltransferase involved in cell wall biosynthesis